MAEFAVLADEVARRRYAMRRPAMKATIIAAVAAAGAIASAGSAGADAPNVGSTCGGDDLGKTATANDGTTIRCIADDAGRLSWFADGGAVGTIAGLQAQGYTVTIDKIGDNPLETCVVTEVHNAMTTTSLNSGGTSPGGPGSIGNKHSTTVVVSKKIDVSLDCTAPG
ncbi:exported hypothetical protein [uncultured Mycobacterium sp.]|uniref:Uncharacterized protein n=1 Tax=uncultured Mycobacterium sp. TaxID=171292 RepID=A0A1Y5PH29_9MYCO|nr:exported hypothetical protein [uncultured Mycobacterium sp.]